MAEGMSEDFSRQLSNLVTALVNLAPSRNYITQFLYVIRMNQGIDYRVLEDAYPDIVKDEYYREAFAKAFGVSFGEKVSLDSRGYGWFLTDFIERVFQLFENPEFRAKVNTLLRDEYPQGIPNLAEEWLDVRLRGLSSEPSYGKDAVRVLKEILRLGRAKAEDLERLLGLSRGNIIQCLNLLDLYKLVTKDFDGSYKPAEDLKKYPRILEGLG